MSIAFTSIKIAFKITIIKRFYEKADLKSKKLVNILAEDCHSAPRITILGTINQFQVNCCAVLKATTQTEQMIIYQQQYINSDES